VRNAVFARQERLDEEHKQTNLQINRPFARRLTTSGGSFTMPTEAGRQSIERLYFDAPIDSGLLIGIKSPHARHDGGFMLRWVLFSEAVSRAPGSGFVSSLR
jgi:hypothetical protein